MRRFSSPRRRVPAALLATAALAIGLPAFALGDDAADPPAEAPNPISLVTNETTVEYAPGQLVVGLEDDATKAEVKTAVEDAGATVDQSIGAIDAKVLEVPTGEVEARHEEPLEIGVAVSDPCVHDRHDEARRAPRRIPSP